MIAGGGARATAPLMYDLFAVVVHEGGAYGGHYHSYIRELGVRGQQSPPCWFNFNDSNVTEVKPEKLEGTFGGSSCAYMLIYRARSLPAPQGPELPTHLQEEAARRGDKKVGLPTTASSSASVL